MISRASIAGAIGLAGLGALGGAYVLTREPAPSVRVLWKENVTATRRADLERTYLLVNPRAPSPSLAYDLLDTSRRNIEALVKDPAIDDTNDIDRQRFEIRPGTAPGNEEMWIAHRTPGLREPWVRWSGVAVLVVMAIAGFWRLLVARAGSWMRKAFASGTGTGDVFDRLDARHATEVSPSGGLTGVAAKAVVGALLVLGAGVPVLDTWKAWLLGAVLLATIVAVSRRGWWRLGAAVAMTVAALGLKAVLPRADIAEGHNAFLVKAAGETLQRELPSTVFDRWKAELDARYPPGAAGDAGSYQWRNAGVPATLFTRSADAIWRPAKYTRQVDTIGFTTLGEFRGGFANEPAYNFWEGPLTREAMPFFVMYELTPASVGSRLSWKGPVFWEQRAGAFEEVRHEHVAAREITGDDVGKRVYAAFFPQPDQRLDFALELSPALRVARWLEALLTVSVCLATLALTVRVRWGAFLRALLIVGLAALAIAAYSPGRAEYLGRTYPPQSGGDDGMVHDGFGRAMAMLAARGQVVEALEGGEPVYWFTPGLRYVRMVEKLVFGDTNHLLLLVLAGLPVVVFFLMQHLAGTWWGWVSTVLFCLNPVGSFSFLQYVAYAKAGYGEPIGVALFLLGLALTLRHQPVGSGRSLVALGVAGAALAGSMFIRPNFSLAVVWLALAYAWASWRVRAVTPLLAVSVGLALALWMPFHNWYYGGEFRLISKPGSTISVTLGPRDYATAARDLLAGRADSRVVAETSRQVKRWLVGGGFTEVGGPGLARAAESVKLVALLVCCGVVLLSLAGRLAGGPGLGVVAVAALCAHAPMLFIFNPYFRYASLAWDLSSIALIVVLARLWRTAPVGTALVRAA